MKKIVVCVLLLSYFWASMAFASFPEDGSPAFFMKTRGITVKQLLASMGQNYNVPVMVSDAVSGQFIGQIDHKTPKEILNDLSSQFNLAWYYDGNTLYVNSADEEVSKLVTASYLKSENLYRDLKSSLNFSSPFNKVIFNRASNSIRVSGVPQFVTDAEKVVESMESVQKKQEDEEVTVNVYPLKYASAADISYSYRNKSVNIPGVAKQMQTILGGTGSYSKESGKNHPNLPKVTVDSRQNAVTVMGLTAKMPMYEKLIAQLDKPQKPVNISVSIIDVDAGDLNSLGVDWAVSADTGSGKVSFNNDSLSSGGNVSAVINDSKNFMVRINALESKAKAQILSSPSVLTLDNMPAILNRNTTFYTKLEGKNTAKLEQVSTGELLRVTPHLIQGKGKQEQVLLTLSIESGGPQGNTQTVDNLPQTQDSQINTQARLNTGQSLLIGGFVRNEDLKQTRKIPLLGDIPWVGSLFRSTAHTKRNMVRLFLIQANPENI